MPKIIAVMTAIIKDKKGGLLSLGKNSYIKTHPLMYKTARSNGNFNPLTVYIHAEVDAIVKCKNIEKAYSIDVYRINSAGKYVSSKPCSVCLSVIQSTGIRKIGYVTKDNEYVVDAL